MTIRQTIKDYEDVMTFGKYKGKSVDWISEKDPGYIVWLVENDVVKCDEEIYEAALLDEMQNYPPEDFFWQPD